MAFKVTFTNGDEETVVARTIVAEGDWLVFYDEANNEVARRRANYVEKTDEAK